MREAIIKVSIVTNAFNQARYLALAMESVLSQSWQDLEYLVVDPGSTDDTPEIIRSFQHRYPGRITHITGCDHGPADGLNRAFSRATGELFGYLNADDAYLPGCICEAVRAAEVFPRADAIYADGYKVDEKGARLQKVISTKFSAKRFVYGGTLVLQQSTFYRAQSFRAVGGFNAENRTSWDAEILFDMSLKGMSLVHVRGFWSEFRVHPQSITGSQRLAEESRRTHARYFRTAMHREKTAWDKAASKAVFGYTLLTEPHSLVARIGNRFGLFHKERNRTEPSQMKVSAHLG